MKCAEIIEQEVGKANSLYVCRIPGPQRNLLNQIRKTHLGLLVVLSSLMVPTVEKYCTNSGILAAYRKYVVSSIGQTQLPKVGN